MYSESREQAVFWPQVESWSYDSCTVVISQKRRREEEAFPRSYLAGFVYLIQEKCVQAQHGYRGGWHDIGITRSGQIAIVGRPRSYSKASNGSRLGERKTIATHRIVVAGTSELEIDRD